MEIDEETLARIYSFDLKFTGGKRTKFYRKLFGFESKTKREDQSGNEKVYENFYPGVVTPIPHLRLGKSVLAVPKLAREELDHFFNNPDWEEIELHSFDGILTSDERMKSMKRTLGRIKIGKEKSLDEEITSLQKLISKNALEEQDFPRLDNVVKKCDRLKKYDWTDDKKFSKYLEVIIDSLKEIKK